MIKKISLFIASIATMLSMGAFMFAPATVYAQDSTTESTQAINCGVTGSFSTVNPSAADCGSTVDADNTVNNTIKLVIRILQVVVGIISVVMIIFGGLKYITSGGDAASVTSAKNTIIYACIGLIVVALAEVIVQFVLNRVDTVTV